jgi:hypothetical protein
MMIPQIILLILAIPAGYLIAWMARDELVTGKRWFRILIVASVALAGLFWLFGKNYVSFSLIFVALVSLVSLIKSEDKKWTKKKI